MAALTEVTGIVSYVNGTGFKLEGREGYLNISRFSEPRPAMPEVGQHVTLGLDNQGYVRTLEETADKPPPATGPVRETARPGVCLSLRVAALQSAATFLAGREDVDGTDLLEVAARFEAWLSR